MKLIVEGGAQDIQFVTSICRDKVRRGLLRLTPVTDTVIVPDNKDVAEDDVKEVVHDDDKELPEVTPKEEPATIPKKRRIKKSE